MLTTSWMTPKSQQTNSSRAPKITDKEIEVLLKKGILGLLDEEENEAGEAHAMDIDELIKNSKTTNYSMINDKYTITRMNVITDNQEKKVDIDDPDFWKKVLKDEETIGKKMLKEFTQLKENNDFMNEEMQNEFFTRLNSEIFVYVEKAKTGEVNYEEEEIFFKILQQVVDDPFVREDLKTVSTLLMGDIRKKPRRLKKRDVSGKKRANKRVRKPKIEEMGDSKGKKSKVVAKEEEEFILEEVSEKAIKTKSKKDNKKKRKGKGLGKRQKMEEEGLYRNSDSETSELGGKNRKQKVKNNDRKKAKGRSTLGKSKTSPKNSKVGKDKKLKKVKLADKSVNMNAKICIFCKDSQPSSIIVQTANPNMLEIETSEKHLVVECSPCKRTFHAYCLQSHLHAITQSSNIEPSVNLQNVLKDPNISIYNAKTSQCLNCQAKLIDCFVCKNVGKIKDKVDIRCEKSIREAILNSTRSMQRDDSTAFQYDELGIFMMFAI